MRLSVVLCTFNGELFLSQQLASIGAQSRPPDELIICDDASTDRTVDLLEEFAKSSPVAPRITVNESTRGTVANFESAISAATGDVIVLADQDDEWHRDRLETIVRIFEESASVDAIFGDADLIDDNGKRIGKTLWEHIDFSRSDVGAFDRGDGLEVLMRRSLATGATMAFRRSTLAWTIPFPRQTRMMHDRWVSLVVAAMGQIRAVSEPLLSYRVHQRQQAGVGRDAAAVQNWVMAARETGRSQFAEWAEELGLVAQRLVALGSGSSTAHRQLVARIVHLRFRSTLPASLLRRLPLVLREAARLEYHRHSNGIWSIAKDLLQFGK